MLRFFRINDPYRLVFIFLILIVVRITQSFFIDGQFVMELKWLLLGEWLDKGFKMYREAYDYTGPLAAMIYKCMDFLFGRSPFAHHVVSSLVIIFQAALFNSILLKNKAFDENNYLPGFFYVIVILSIPDFMSLSPQLMSMTFILKALSSVLRRIDNQATDELFLNSGLFVGTAAMIYLPASIFFFVFLVSLIVFSSAITRRLLLYFFGFTLVIGLCAVYFLWRGDMYYFLEFFFKQGLLLEGEQLLSPWEIIMVSGFLIGAFIIAIFKAISASRLTNFQQRLQQVIWFMFLGGIGCFFMANKKTGLELLYMTPLLAYFLTHYFMLIRRRIAKAIMPAIVVFGMIGFNIFSYGNFLEPLIVPEVVTDQKNVMVLNENFGYYLEKESGSPCFSKPICMQAFEGLDYYESSAGIYKLIEKSTPDLIIDEIGIAESLFFRFPLLEEQYKKRNSNSYVRINN